MLYLGMPLHCNIRVTGGMTGDPSCKARDVVNLHLSRYELKYKGTFRKNRISEALIFNGQIDHSLDICFSDYFFSKLEFFH